MSSKNRYYLKKMLDSDNKYQWVTNNLEDNGKLSATKCSLIKNMTKYEDPDNIIDIGNSLEKQCDQRYITDKTNATRCKIAGWETVYALHQCASDRKKICRRAKSITDTFYHQNQDKLDDICDPLDNSVYHGYDLDQAFNDINLVCNDDSKCDDQMTAMSLSSLNHSIKAKSSFDNIKNACQIAASLFE